MIKQLSDNIVYVSGKAAAAIYDFETGKVFAINSIGKSIVEKVIQYEDISDFEMRYIEQLKSVVGIEEFSDFSDYNVNVREKSLNFVWLELTQCCNSRCVHCYEGNVHTEVSNPLTVSEWKSIILQLKEVGCKHIQFIGGEPTLYKEIRLLITFAYSIGIRTSVYSNLISISEELIQTFKETDTKIKTSIYGHNAKIQELVTQIPGSFDKWVYNVNRLKANDISVECGIVLMRENEACKELILDFVKQLGFDKVSVDEIRKVYGGCQEKHMLKNGYTKRKRTNFKADKKHFDNAGYKNTCWYGKMVISTDGTVYPCEFERNITYGNIRVLPIKQLLESEKLMQCWYLDFSKIEGCSECEYRFACRDCRPVAYAEKANLYEKNPRCAYNPEIGVWEIDEGDNLNEK